MKKRPTLSRPNKYTQLVKPSPEKAKSRVGLVEYAKAKHDKREIEKLIEQWKSARRKARAQA